MTRYPTYPCCEHVHIGHAKAKPHVAGWRWLPCAVADCPGAQPAAGGGVS